MDWTTFTSHAVGNNYTLAAPDCTTILIDIAGFQTDLSSPPPSMFARVAQTFNQALTFYSAACNDVIKGAAQMDPALFSTATTERGIGSELMDQATGEVQALIGR